MYNIIFTSAPIVVFALFDKQFKAKYLLNNPAPNYFQGLLNLNFNKMTFWQSFGLALFNSALIGYSSVVILSESYEGKDTYMILVGNYMYSNIIIIVNLKILLISTCITPILIVSVLISIVSYFLIFFFLSQLPFLDVYKVIFR